MHPSACPQVDREARLRRMGSRTALTSRIPHNANRKTRAHPAQSHRQPGAELHEPCVDWHLLLERVGDNDGGDEAVDREDLGHDGAKTIVVAIPYQHVDFVSLGTQEVL